MVDLKLSPSKRSRDIALNSLSFPRKQLIVVTDSENKMFDNRRKQRGDANEDVKRGNCRVKILLPAVLTGRKLVLELN